MNFDDVVPKLLEVGSKNPTMKKATQIAVVRDPRGRVRLAMNAHATDELRASLENALTKGLAGWYLGPVLFHDDRRPAPRRLAREVLEQASGKWPAGWPDYVEHPIRGGETPIDRQQWTGLQRVLSKESWLSDQQVTSPWPVRAQTPTIVSFYSYKGGVGRSTLVALVAVLLARAGDNVVVIDLDLEAPGQQALFNVDCSRGVIDYLVEHIALGQSDINELLEDVSDVVEGKDTGNIHLACAGKTGWSYVEKIARLDYVAHTGGEESPVQYALTTLLKEIKRKVTPDWILIDARTGIHDLGGLAVHALAHIDVLLARHGRQGREGIEM